MEKAFAQALSNFTYDVASGGAIRHLTDLGYTVNEIAAKLDYPTPMSKIREIVWKHLLDNGIVSEEKPDDAEFIEKVTYVRDYAENGKSYYKQVVERVPKAHKEYYYCDFGKRMYQSKEAFECELQALDSKDRDYILGLPWPLGGAYHIKDERMIRIMEVLQNQNE